MWSAWSFLFFRIGVATTSLVNRELITFYLRRCRVGLLLAATLPLAGCGDCLKFSWGGGSNCSDAEAVGTIALLAPVAVVALPFILVGLAADGIGDSGAAPDSPPRNTSAVVRPAAPQPNIRAVRECRPGAASCVVRVSCPTGAAQCVIPSINRSCPGGQKCEFQVVQP